MRFLLKHKLRHNIALTFQSENSPRQILPLEAKPGQTFGCLGDPGPGVCSGSAVLHRPLLGVLLDFLDVARFASN
jgi:hypothetical protein